MKKRRYVIIVMFLILTIIISIQINNSNTTNLINYEIVTKTIYTNTSTDFVNFQIPQLSSKTKGEFSETNKLIFNQVNKHISQYGIGDLFLSEQITNSNWSEYVYEQIVMDGEYKVTFNSDKIMSILFSGIVNKKNSAHPTRFAFSINIDLNTEQFIDIRSMYNFNDEFKELFYKNMKKWLLRTELKDIFGTYIESQTLKELFKEDNIEFYLTKNKLGIIINKFPYAIGDYVIFEIPNDEISQYQINNYL